MSARATQFRRAAFTWFAYTSDTLQHLQSMDNTKCKYLIVGFEICPETGQRHLQGYIEFKSPLALSTVKSRLDPINKAKSTVHVEAAHKCRDANIAYCKKEESADLGMVAELGYKWFERVFEETPQEPTDQPLSKGEADLRSVVELAQTGTHSLSEVASAFPTAALKHASGVKAIIESAKIDCAFEGFKERMTNGVPNSWQREFIGTVIDQPVDNRAVWWIYDTIGGTGKSWLCDYLIATRGAVFFENAKSRDIAHAYNGEPVVVFDLARCSEGKVNYGAIESLKNGRIFSSKYDSKSKYFKPPHVVCLANWPPDRAALSQDRWHIVDLNDQPTGQEDL